MGVELVESPSLQDLTRLVSGCDLVVPSPGIPESHPIFGCAEAEGVAIESEFDLADRWDSRPIVAITGTDGKTTVTTMVTAAAAVAAVVVARAITTDHGHADDLPRGDGLAFKAASSAESCAARRLAASASAVREASLASAVFPLIAFCCSNK